VRALRTGRNDLDKLCRAVFDSLAGVLFPDDSGVFQLTARKELVDCDPGVKVRATEIDDLPSGRLIPITSLADEEYPF